MFGILVPQAGSKPASPVSDGVFLTTEPPGKSRYQFFFRYKKDYLFPQKFAGIWIKTYPTMTYIYNSPNR